MKRWGILLCEEAESYEGEKKKQEVKKKKK